MQSTVSNLKNGGSGFRIEMLESHVNAPGKKLNLISKNAELYQREIGQGKMALNQGRFGA